MKSVEQVEPSVLNIKKDGSADITLTSTIPYGCYANLNEKPTGKCANTIIIQYPDNSIDQCEIDDTYSGSSLKMFKTINDIQAKCGAEIEVTILLFNIVWYLFTIVEHCVWNLHMPAHNLRLDSHVFPSHLTYLLRFEYDISEYT